MQATAMNPVTSAAAVGDNAALQAQIAALRASLKNQRARAQNMWDACSPNAGEEVAENRVALGRFTEKLLKGQMEEAYG